MTAACISQRSRLLHTGVACVHYDDLWSTDDLLLSMDISAVGRQLPLQGKQLLLRGKAINCTTHLKQNAIKKSHTWSGTILQHYRAHKKNQVIHSRYFPFARTGLPYSLSTTSALLNISCRRKAARHRLRAAILKLAPIFQANYIVPELQP